MSNTYKDKIKAKWKAGLILKTPLWLQKTFDKWNFDYYEDRIERQRKKEKIIDKELKKEL